MKTETQAVAELDTGAVAAGAKYYELQTPKQAKDSQFKYNDADTDGGDDTSIKLVSIFELFSFADRTDKILMTVGTISALIAGISQPLQIVLIGDVMNAFNPMDLPDAAQLRSNVNTVALNFVLVSIGVFAFCFLQVACWSLTASRQAKHIRSAYVNAILNKEIGWFDVNEPMQLSTRVADSTVTIQEGMGRKVGDGLHFFSMAVSGVMIGLIKGWELALILLAFMPLLAFSAFASMRRLADATQTGIESYGKAGAVAQEALGNVRTVHMFNAIQHFVTKYGLALEESVNAGIRKGFAVGWGIGVMFFVLYCTYAAGLYFGAVQIGNDQLDGSKCTGSGCYDGGKVMTVFFSVSMGAMALGQAGPSIQAVFAARTAAYSVFAVIKRRSAINPQSEEGEKLEQVKGKITLDSVTFAYPSRPDANVCRNYSLTIEAGETVALVGPSGSGKSTIVSLLERFYDPQSGVVQVDGVDVRGLNVKWLREQIGLVGQEPALFATSILENIRHGRPSATDDEVKEAARMANAYDFIMEFPQGFATEVGERGAQLSGGQKQRIAIARAIVKNPPILLLDEATSALDTESERVVQESLDKLLAASKRTTIIIAHRLSTIQNADRIAVHRDGQIIEIGTHEELMRIADGQYKALVEAQNRAAESSSGETSPPLSPSHEVSGAVAARRRSLSYSAHSQRGSFHKMPADEEGSEEAPENKVPLSRVWKMASPEWPFLALGGAGGIVNAAVFPIWGVILCKIITMFFKYDKTKDEMLDNARAWSIGLVALGVVFALSIIAQHYGFAVASQKLVGRVRLQTFQAMLQQEIGWFDLDENASGALVSKLATDSATLQAMTSDTLNQGLVNVTTLAIGLGIAFYYSWQMTLANLATLPILGFSAFIQSKQLAGTINNRENNEADLAAGAVLAEAISSIRTVASFSMEKAINVAYVTFIDASKKTDIKVGIMGGLTFGMAQGLMFLNLAFLFFLGGKWVANKTVAFDDMFMVMIVLVLSMFPIGMAAQNATDSTKAKKAASSIFQIIDRTPQIDSTSTTGKELTTVRGELEFQHVAFAYPSRPDAHIYKNYNLKIRPGQTVALVGSSGSGKSTAISLLERFYDPSAGSVTLDGTDLRSLRLPWLRERISLVSQEPVLFAGSIAENIGMGKPGATREEVIDAAKKSNAFDFISNFPNGFDTDVGDRGAQVSGGQKQRIAIARAILRDPEVLLLDEATSALDNESERVVQESLDRLLALKQRTTIIVAHRLSTIRNADLIAVTKDGAIVEQGTHDQLMAIPNGVYKGLVARQMNSEQ
ncbi:hypothetical protein Poli38472_014553 [Pythium oligandrum]|uniref:Uncharacterized protein n=1 Tax=Pythium oligandrum TaxID=41045 RepID=A0A8K1CF83_PYTOL|nr:hypothetical protein Poli38472_014553 [Pythium oligandrum]|eukprot:TMW61092.1 hypothetical protein Poli38472_014553 [Pythium oligandrum]